MRRTCLLNSFAIVAGTWVVSGTLAAQEVPLQGPMLPPPQAVTPLPAGPMLPSPESVMIGPPCPPPKIWEGAVELGLNGSDGNTETFNFRFGARCKRKTPDQVLSLDLIYNKNTADGLETANKSLLDGRNEWIQCDSPWTLFVHGTLEYDEFKAFDARVAADAGVGYQFIKNDSTLLIGRAGPGASQEIGGPDDEIVPEAVFGLEFEHKLSCRQKITASTQYFPALDDVSNYRLDSKAGWEILVDPVWNLSLQLAVCDRYDSTPNGAQANDIDYSMLFLWTF